MMKETTAMVPVQTSSPDDDLVIWRSPDYVARPVSDAPASVNDYPDLLAQARAAIERREQAYPQMIAKGEITPADASADLQGWQAIEREWDWVTTGTGDPPAPETRESRLASVALALARIDVELGRGGASRRADLLHQQDLNLSLRWHLTHLRHGAPAIHFWASLTHKLRTRALRIGQGQCGTCGRQGSGPEASTCTRADCGLPHEDSARIAA